MLDLFKKTINKYNLQVVFFNFIFYIFVLLVTLFSEKINPIISKFFETAIVNPGMSLLVALIIFFSYTLVLIIYLYFILVLYNFAVVEKKNIFELANNLFSKLPSFATLIAIIFLIEIACLAIAVLVGTLIATFSNYFLPLNFALIVGFVVIFLLFQYLSLWFLFSPLALVEDNDYNFRAIAKNFVVLKNKSFLTFLKVLLLDFILFLIFIGLIKILNIPILLKNQTLSLTQNIILNLFYVFLFFPIYIFYLGNLWKEIKNKENLEELTTKAKGKAKLVFILSLIIVFLSIILFIFFSKFFQPLI